MEIKPVDERKTLRNRAETESSNTYMNRRVDRFCGESVYLESHNSTIESVVSIDCFVIFLIDKNVSS